MQYYCVKDCDNSIKKKKEQEGKKLLTSSLACDPHFSFPSLFAETKPLTNQSHTHTQWCWGAERALFFDIPSADCAAVPRGKGHTRQTTTTLPNGSLGLTNGTTKTALVCVRFLKKKSAYNIHVRTKKNVYKYSTIYIGSMYKPNKEVRCRVKNDNEKKRGRGMMRGAEKKKKGKR